MLTQDIDYDSRRRHVLGNYGACSKSGLLTTTYISGWSLHGLHSAGTLCAAQTSPLAIEDVYHRPARSRSGTHFPKCPRLLDDLS